MYHSASSQFLSILVQEAGSKDIGLSRMPKRSEGYAYGETWYRAFGRSRPQGASGKGS